MQGSINVEKCCKIVSTAKQDMMALIYIIFKKQENE